VVLHLHCHRVAAAARLICFHFFFCQHPALLVLHSFPTRRSSDLCSMTPRLRCELQLDYLALRRGSHRGARRQYCSYPAPNFRLRSEEHTSELQSLRHLVCRLLLEKKKKNTTKNR